MSQSSTNVDKEVPTNGSGSIGATIKTTKLTADQIDKLSKIIDAIPDILSKTDNPEYDEIYGYRINVESKDHVVPSTRNEILLKFLIANNYDVDVTKEKLIKTLNWRNSFQPLSAAFEEEFDSIFEALGAITESSNGKPNLKVVTWNLYGDLKDPKKLFEKYDSEDKTSKEGTPFLRWRVGLMERALTLVDFNDPSNHKIAQVHDYNNASMFRMDPGMKATTKQIISLFAESYPELLSSKFFINVPSLMSWAYAFLKLFINAETYKKFHFMNNGDLSEWFGKSDLPSEYNGNVKNDKVSLLQALNESCKPKIKIPEYGKVLLERTSKSKETDEPPTN